MNRLRAVYKLYTQYTAMNSLREIFQLDNFNMALYPCDQFQNLN